MPLYDINSRLSDVIFHDPSILTVLNRFNINIGVGDASIGEVSLRHGVDADFLLAILNTYLNEDYFPEETLRRFSLGCITDYLAKTDVYYSTLQLPIIERHFNSLVSHSAGANNNLGILHNFFLGVKQEMTDRILRNREVLFPAIDKLADGIASDDVKHLIEAELQRLDADHDVIKDKLADLLSFFIVHLRGEYDTNLCRAVVTAVFTLDKDVRQNCRITNRILCPMLLKRLAK